MFWLRHPCFVKIYLVVLVYLVAWCSNCAEELSTASCQAVRSFFCEASGRGSSYLFCQIHHNETMGHIMSGKYVQSYFSFNIRTNLFMLNKSIGWRLLILSNSFFSTGVCVQKQNRISTYLYENILIIVHLKIRLGPVWLNIHIVLHRCTTENTLHNFESQETHTHQKLIIYNRW